MHSSIHESAQDHYTRRGRVRNTQLPDAKGNRTWSPTRAPASGGPRFYRACPDFVDP